MSVFVGVLLVKAHRPVIPLETAGGFGADTVCVRD
jgi:hypothetical protein